MESQFHLEKEVILPVLPQSEDSGANARLHILDVHRAILVYLSRTESVRKVDNLFVTFGPVNHGLKPSVSTLSRWIKQAIVLAYESQGKQIG